MTKLNGKYYIQEGHHRITATKLLGRFSSVEMEVLDYDATKVLLSKSKIVKVRPKAPIPSVEKVSPKPVVKAPAPKKKPSIKPPKTASTFDSVASILTGQEQGLADIAKKSGVGLADARVHLIKMKKAGFTTKTPSGKWKLIKGDLKPPKQKVVPSPKSKATLKRNQDAWESGLTPKERSAFSVYSDEDEYEAIRNCLTKRSGCTKRIANHVRNLNQALKRAPKVPGVTYRGLNFRNKIDELDFIARLRRDGTLTEKSLMSTSGLRSVAEGFTFGPRGKGILLEIEGKSGVSIANLSSSPTELEVLFSPGIKFEMIEFRESLGLKIIRLREI